MTKGEAVYDWFCIYVGKYVVKNDIHEELSEDKIRELAFYFLEDLKVQMHCALTHQLYTKGVIDDETL